MLPWAFLVHMYSFLRSVRPEEKLLCQRVGIGSTSADNYPATSRQKYLNVPVGSSLSRYLIFFFHFYFLAI